ncbi:hypothetical protein [Sinomonas halotolerans]|uniref:Uncharacterized protein n=1 Tax=Sinomonas halotolerans TaxID=1644133 RepID=A0ABU9WZ52_9MICC
MKRRDLVHEHMLEWLQEDPGDDLHVHEGRSRAGSADARDGRPART